MFLRVGFFIGIGVWASGCSIRPLPEQVTGIKTDEIVKHVRCEAREAVKLKAADYLSIHTEDAAALTLAQALASEDYTFDRTQFMRLGSQPRLMLAKVGSSAIAYNFTFDMSEINDLDPAWDGIAGIPNGTFGLGITAGVDRTRHSIRSFTVSDTFVGLLTNVSSDYCKNRTPKGPNYLYPIVGKIGVDEMIDTFIDTSLFDNLAKSDKGPPAISDSIEFQTNLSLGITPSVALTRVTSRLTTKGATFGIVNKRQDSHKVIVGLSRDDTVGPPAALLWLVNGSSKSTPAEVSALNVVDKHILRFEVGQRALLLAP